MEHPAVRILNSHRIMAISTVRPDGWPQTTIVGYANRGFDLVFLIYRSGQKFANIEHDDRISIAVAAEPIDVHELQAVYAAAHAKILVDEADRQEAWRQLMERHSNLAGVHIPDAREGVFVRARCTHVSMLDYTQGLGHREVITVDGDGNVSDGDADKEDWGRSVASVS